jgi:hypothetical protein
MRTKETVIIDMYLLIDWISSDEQLNLILDNFVHQEISMMHLIVKHMEK